LRVSFSRASCLGPRSLCVLAGLHPLLYLASTPSLAPSPISSLRSLSSCHPYPPLHPTTRVSSERRAIIPSPAITYPPCPFPPSPSLARTLPSTPLPPLPPLTLHSPRPPSLTLTLTQLTLHALALTSPPPAPPLSTHSHPPLRCRQGIVRSLFISAVMLASLAHPCPASLSPSCLPHPLPLPHSASPSLTLISLPPSVTPSCLPSAVASTPSRIQSYPCRNLITSCFTFLIALVLLFDRYDIYFSHFLKLVC
jgi:hypothetical protein